MNGTEVSRVVHGAEVMLVAAAAHDDGSVRSVDRAASLLVALGDSDGLVGVTDLARRLGLHKSTTSRLLATLEKSGLVEQDEATGRYRLGLAIVRLGGHAERTLDLRSIALPELQGLARSVRETTALAVVESDSVVTVAWADPNGTGHDRANKLLPLHATAAGKVLLSCQPEREIIRLSKTGLLPHTGRTIVRADMLLEELARVRRRGFATAFGEHQPMLNAVAVPVFDPRASVVAALEVRGFGSRIQPSRIPELLGSIREAAAAITEHIGGVAASCVSQNSEGLSAPQSAALR